MYKYTIRIYFEKEKSYKLEHNKCEIKTDFYIYITKEDLCSIDEIKEEATSLFSPRFGKINFLSIDITKIKDDLGLSDSKILTDYSPISIEWIDSTIIQNVLTRSGKFVTVNPQLKKYDSVTLDQIEKVIQFEIPDEKIHEYWDLAWGWLSAPRAKVQKGYDSKCLVKLKNGRYGLCWSYETDFKDNIKTNYLKFFKEHNLYEIQSFEDYRKLVYQLERH